MAEITYRQLPASDYPLLAEHPFLKGLPAPNPDSCVVIVAEEGGKIVGFQMLTLVYHLEPIWVDPKHRGTGMAEKLFKMAASCLDHFLPSVAFVFSPDSIIAGYLKRLGLKKLPWDTYLYDPHSTMPPEAFEVKD